MSFPVASLPQQTISHDWEHCVVLANNHTLYISKSPVRDKCVRDYDDSLFSVTFSEGDEDTVKDVTRSIAFMLNAGPSWRRKEILKRSQQVHPSDFDDAIKAGSIFAHRPVVGQHLQLCFVPCVFIPGCQSSVLALKDLREQRIVREIH